MTYNTGGQVPVRFEKPDRRAVLFAASALLIFGSFLGCATYRFLGIGKSELYDKLIERYFLAMYGGCETPLDTVLVTLDCAAHELWSYALLFAAGFTPFGAPVGGLLLLYRGLLFGFSLTTLQFSAKTGLLISSVIYLVSALILSGLLALLFTEAVSFYGSTPKLRLRDLRSTAYTLTFLRVCALAVCTVVTMLFLLYVYI